MNKKRDRLIILVAHDNMAICLMVYILASLPKDFNNLARLSNQQFHVGCLAYAHNPTFSLISASMLLRGGQAALNDISTASKSFLPSQLWHAQHILGAMIGSSFLVLLSRCPVIPNPSHLVVASTDLSGRSRLCN
jgi:hypothetical protein